MRLPAEMELSCDEKLVLQAQFAESAERYDDMAEFMKERAEKGGPMSADERDLFSAAYKGAITGRRQAVRIAQSVQNQEAGEGNSHNAELARGFRTKVEAELAAICEQAAELLRERLVPLAADGEPKAFFLKMQGDYYRYMNEFATDSQRSKASEQALESYVAATEQAKLYLLTTHPVRLALALNFAVFQCEVNDNRTEAISIASEALTSAERDLDGMPEEAHNDAGITLTLLAENLGMWISNEQQA